MNRTFLSTFRKCTWAALNGLGASTIPDTVAVPAIGAASWARAGAIAVVPASIVSPIANRVGGSRRLVHMATLLRSRRDWATRVTVRPTRDITDRSRPAAGGPPRPR